MTKILYLIDGLPNGGAERQLALLLKYLPQGWETRVVSLRGGPYYQVLLDQRASVVVYQRRSRYDLIPVFQLYSEILRYKPDIIHSWGFLCSALVAPLCKVLRIKMIDGSIRTGGHISSHPFRTRISLFLADKIIANSLAGVQYFKISKNKGNIIYNGFDPERLTLINSCEGVIYDRFTVIMAARMSPVKDFSTFIQAAILLSKLDPNGWKFIILTDDGTKEDFGEKIDDLLLTGNLEIPISTLEIIPYLKNAHVGVLLTSPGTKEGFSNTIMEYMGCGLPVISTDCGGNREIVRDGETGYLIPPKSVKDLVQKLLSLKGDQGKRIRMGEEGKKRVLEMCNVNRMIGEFTAVYQELLSP